METSNAHTDLGLISDAWNLTIRNSTHAVNNHLGAAQLLLELLSGRLKENEENWNDTQEILSNLRIATREVAELRLRLPERSQ